MERGSSSSLPLARAILLIFVVSALLGGYRFQESLPSWEVRDTNLPETLDMADTHAGRKIVRLSKTPNFNRYDLLIWDSAIDAGVDPNLWKAVIMVESGGNVDAVSIKGAMGLAQLMPKTAESLGLHKEDSFDPESNLRTGASYLGWLLVRFGGSFEMALAAYNAGPEAVKRHGGVPSYKETRRYVRSVLTMYRWISSHPHTWSHLHRTDGPATTLLPAGMRVSSTFSIAG